MKKIIALLTGAVLTALANYSQAQSPTASPTPNPNVGTYLDATLSIPRRLQLADGALATGTDQNSVFKAADFMLRQRPVASLLNAYPAFPPAVLADPTLSGTIANANLIGELYLDAVWFTVRTIPALNARVAFLQPLLSSTLFTPSQVVSAKQKYADLVTAQATFLANSGDYADAITTVAPVLGWSGNQALTQMANWKVFLHAPDVLSWAKLVYLSGDFAHTQDGINAVSSAFRALDTNLVRANQFIAFQTSGTGTNPLAGVSVPQVTFLGTDPAAQALNAGVAGNTLTALTIAAGQFSSAEPGPALNKATALVAQWLRNIDENLVRANAFVNAQTQGQPYTIPELSGTSGN